MTMPTSYTMLSQYGQIADFTVTDDTSWFMLVPTLDATFTFLIENGGNGGYINVYEVIDGELSEIEEIFMSPSYWQTEYILEGVADHQYFMNIRNFWVGHAPQDTTLTLTSTLIPPVVSPYIYPGMYDKGKYRLMRVSEQSDLDIGMRLDVTTLDEEIGAYQEVPTSVVSYSDGYTTGSAGEQSIDPATGTATLVEDVSTIDDPSFLKEGDYVESYYEEVLGFSGIVRQVNVETEVDPNAVQYGHIFQRQTTYQLASLELLLLSRTAKWVSLPAEGALTRLSRWFDVDYSAVSEPHRIQLNALMESEEAGEASLLELARRFSEVTKLPLRLAMFRGPTFLEVFDTTVPWTDQPLLPTPGFEDSELWTNRLEMEDGVPAGLTVRENDMRLMGGTTTVGLDQPLPDEDFYLDSSRVDAATELAVGFRAPMPIDVAGFTLPVLRVTQSFGDIYTAAIELDPTGATGALSSGEAVSHKPVTAPVSSSSRGFYTWVTNRGGGVEDDTAYIQALIDEASRDGGGTVGIPRGRYNITGLQGKPGVSIIGEGDSASVLQMTTEAGAISFVSGAEIVGKMLYSNFGMVGVESGSEAGIDIGTTSGGGANPADYIRLEKLSIDKFGGPALHARGWIVSSISDIIAAGNLGGGFFIDGTKSWVTSTVLTDCYANACGPYGYKFYKCTYVGGQGLATDSCVRGYDAYDISAAAFLNCGVEVPTAEGWYIDGSGTFGTTALSLVSCYSTEGAGAAYSWNGYSTGVMTASRAFNSSATPPTSLYVASTAAVLSVGGVYNSTITGPGRRMFMDAVDAVGNPIGLSAGPSAPHILPWTDSIQIKNRGNAANPILVVYGMSGQSGSFARYVTSTGTNKLAFNPQGDGQIAFGAAEDVILERPSGVGYLSTNRPLRLPHYGSVASLPSASAYENTLATVDTDTGPKQVLSNGVTWLTPNTGYWQPVV